VRGAGTAVSGSCCARRPPHRASGGGGGAGDALRPFLLHAFGGLYLDVDVECFEAVDASLGGFDIVLQLEDGGNKSLNNAVMAGVPGHELWAKMQGLLHERRARAPAGSLASHAGAPISAHVRTKRLNNCEYPGRAGPVYAYASSRCPTAPV